jgi:uncharacterized membrane protein
MNVKKTNSPLLKIGLLIFAVTMIVQRFITQISNFVVILLLVIAIALIIVGGLKKKEKS